MTTRDQAIRLIARQALKSLTPAERQSLLEEWWGHAADLRFLDDDLKLETTRSEAPVDSSEQRYDPLLLFALQTQLAHVSNAYLYEKLSELGDAPKIEGAEPELLACPCCSYRTLARRGHYDICPVCFWEDDGGDDPARYSSPNHMTLAEARHNFARLGACSAVHLNHIDPEGKRKYRR